jgi:hypothetical protein
VLSCKRSVDSVYKWKISPTDQCHCYRVSGRLSSMRLQFLSILGRLACTEVTSLPQARFHLSAYLEAWDNWIQDWASMVKVLSDYGVARGRLFESRTTCPLNNDSFSTVVKMFKNLENCRYGSGNWSHGKKDQLENTNSLTWIGQRVVSGIIAFKQPAPGC